MLLSSWQLSERDHLKHQTMPKFKALPPLEELQKAFQLRPRYRGVHPRLLASLAELKTLLRERNNQGYIILKHKSVLFKSSRPLFVTGEDPGDSIVDHKDRNKSNNRASNLRLVTDNRTCGIQRPVGLVQGAVTPSVYNALWKNDSLRHLRQCRGGSSRLPFESSGVARRVRASRI